MTFDRVPVALTIAGSDSGGGAGIQADLRTFAFHAVHGTSALTCVTAQNTLGVDQVEALPPDAVLAQIDAVVKDMGVDGAKTGMLLNADIMSAVAEAIEQFGIDRLVVDPVMVSRTGAQLIDDRAIATLIDRIIPQAAILTPNRYEAQILAQQAVNSLDDMKTAAERIHRLGPRAVLIKGGGMQGELRGLDVWFDGDQLEILQTETVETPHTHGTGCTLSAGTAANLALGKPPLTAVRDAKTYLTRALHHALAIGGGQGPVCHFFPLRERD
ncbi:bifunctional hydroxymethylpyrimidine kinase/phosphomethylpyrimidine kinase [Baaleninema sp.]|uniref:bifunctional hydroxymethylpyrimidine kinase/phosphomethylpyrimidine kinase n=1 Tax=Baaleninema sp. TaxID=3101197 RepID=UPI003CFCA3AD